MGRVRSAPGADTKQKQKLLQARCSSKESLLCASQKAICLSNKYWPDALRGSQDLRGVGIRARLSSGRDLQPWSPSPAFTEVPAPRLGTWGLEGSPARSSPRMTAKQRQVRLQVFGPLHLGVPCKVSRGRPTGLQLSIRGARLLSPAPRLGPASPVSQTGCPVCPLSPSLQGRHHSPCPTTTAASLTSRSPLSFHPPRGHQRDLKQKSGLTHALQELAATRVTPPYRTDMWGSGPGQEMPGRAREGAHGACTSSPPQPAEAWARMADRTQQLCPGRGPRVFRAPASSP